MVNKAVIILCIFMCSFSTSAGTFSYTRTFTPDDWKINRAGGVTTTNENGNIFFHSPKEYQELFSFNMISSCCLIDSSKTVEIEVAVNGDFSKPGDKDPIMALFSTKKAFGICGSSEDNAIGWPVPAMGWIVPNGASLSTPANFYYDARRSYETITGSGDATTTQYKFQIRNNPTANTFEVLSYERKQTGSSYPKIKRNLKTYSDHMSDLSNLKFGMGIEQLRENNKWGISSVDIKINGQACSGAAVAEAQTTYYKTAAAGVGMSFALAGIVVYKIILQNDRNNIDGETQTLL